jgi:hypothetical protein
MSKARCSDCEIVSPYHTPVCPKAGSEPMRDLTRDLVLSENRLLKERCNESSARVVNLQAENERLRLFRKDQYEETLHLRKQVHELTVQLESEKAQKKDLERALREEKESVQYHMNDAKGLRQDRERRRQIALGLGKEIEALKRQLQETAVILNKPKLKKSALQAEIRHLKKMLVMSRKTVLEELEEAIVFNQARGGFHILGELKKLGMKEARYEMKRVAGRGEPSA